MTNYTLRRLRPLRHHRVRVRAVGHERSWLSAWSNEVSFKTTSVEAARDSGNRISADGFFVPSERRLRKSVCGDAREETFDSAIDDILGSALGTMEEGAVVKDLLDARLCRGGSREFIRHGRRYSQPPSERQQRMQRMRLVVTAKELYQPHYADGNRHQRGKSVCSGCAWSSQRKNYTSQSMRMATHGLWVHSIMRRSDALLWRLNSEFRSALLQLVVAE